ncbi:Gfo/Idh/MocA family protein [Pseudalkalibacillus decolorationis]|uniref:Gfo/Idh/MocA family protein n=1 Tax=Pseudalkalibacillus decolorationis TaxID=163879 RepID=UPI0021489AA0|nr:Gfo/Idh/MocA family oxidoreductase [Pseudalkalibacillus decolorationis]
MGKEFRFGIVGCGVISGTHAEEIKKIENARLVAVADSQVENAKRFGGEYGVDWYADYHKMLSREDIDVVNILTPSGMHADMAVTAAKYGKHVIVEKPMDVTLEKAHEMIKACRDAGVKLSIISQHRFDPDVVKVKQEIESGKLGKTVLGMAAVNWYRSQEYYDSGEWRGTWALDGGGALMNQSIHYIDLLQYMMGPVESIYAHADTLAHERIEVEDVAVATVKFKNGALGTIVGTTSAYPGLHTRLEVFGTNGTAVIETDKLKHFYLRQQGNQESFYGGGKVENSANKKYASEGETGASNPSSIHGSSHQLQLEDMIQAIQDDREPVVNGEEGLKPLEIILAIYQSAQTGKSVQLPLKVKVEQ